MSDYFREEKILLNNFIELGSIEAMKELVKLGLGAGILARWIARGESNDGSPDLLPLGPRCPLAAAGAWPIGRAAACRWRKRASWTYMQTGNGEPGPKGPDSRGLSFFAVEL